MDNYANICLSDQGVDRSHFDANLYAKNVKCLVTHLISNATVSPFAATLRSPLQNMYDQNLLVSHYDCIHIYTTNNTIHIILDINSAHCTQYTNTMVYKQTQTLQIQPRGVPISNQEFLRFIISHPNTAIIIILCQIYPWENHSFQLILAIFSLLCTIKRLCAFHCRKWLKS